jgi:hypothetical protein
VVAILEAATKRARANAAAELDEHIAQLHFPLAICLSMVDKLPNEERIAALDEPRMALKQRIGEVPLRWLESAFPNNRLFAISSTGLKTGAVEPINVAEMIGWFDEQTQSEGDVPDVSVAGIVSEAPSRLRSASLRHLRKLFPVALLTAGSAAALGWHQLRSDQPRQKAPTNVASVAVPLPSEIEIRRLLDEGRIAARNGRWADVLKAMGVVQLTSENPHAVDWDTLVANAALFQSRTLGADGRPLLEVASTRFSSALDQLPPGSQAGNALRAGRAEACVEGGLKCDPSQLNEDVTLASTSDDPSVRQRAREVARRLGHI